MNNMANVQRYSVAQQGNLQLSANFLVREFASQDGADTVLIDLDLVNQLQAIRDKLDVPVTVTSGYRTAAHNAAVGGEPGSLHTLGRAADIIARGKTTLEVAACAESIGASGILRYITSGFVHVDTRENRGFYNVTNGAFSPVSSFGGSESAQTIAAIQRRMNEQYGAGLQIDGIFGPASKRALIKGLQTELNAQYSAGLAVDGFWGPATKAACPEIGDGSGEIHYIIQAGLFCIADCVSLTVDGVYSESTMDAVRTFQTANGLPATGVTDPDTFAALFG